MKERPILFSAPMVRAILDGRKTQTRRVVSHKWPHLWNEPWYATGKVISDLPTQLGAFMEFRYRQQDEPAFEGSRASTLVPCPHGKPGDRLWVRETHAFIWPGDSAPDDIKDCNVQYRADTDGRSAPGAWPDDERSHPEAPRWKPSIFMPRWASRITLEITAVRVERLQDISDDDCLAEGVESTASDAGIRVCHVDNAHMHFFRRGSFALLWESLNGAGTWADNPWVWVIEFKRINPDATTPA